MQPEHHHIEGNARHFQRTLSVGVALMPQSLLEKMAEANNAELQPGDAVAIMATRFEIDVLVDVGGETMSGIAEGENTTLWKLGELAALAVSIERIAQHLPAHCTPFWDNYLIRARAAMAHAPIYATDFTAQFEDITHHYDEGTSTL